ncbi:MAG TPA: ABC transporter permease [Acidimicrobiales bacterium]|nr:ABC transporter permease [Acidimicrobiales bacterium]
MNGPDSLVWWDWVGNHLDDIAAATSEHLQLTFYAVAIGLAISLVLAVVSLRWRRAYGPLVGFTNVLYSIPSLALFGIFVPITGFGFVTAEIALVSYTLLILLRNIVSGIDGVSPAVIEAADAMGYEPWRRFLTVELRLAAPAIVTGLRIATVTVIGLVTVAALIGSGGYGTFIRDGLSRSFSTPIIVGGGLSIALALMFDLIFIGIQWLITPWARKGALR